MPLERSAFRPDLEGLRGVSILLVVLFHAGVAAAAGGFVGVDVFFVLSGFFITGMLAGEATETGSVNLSAFWANRSLRLLPALLVVLAFTLAAVMWLYAPIDRAEIARNARAVALYSGNIEFARNSADYFRSAENPLLHTWSLGVEEQFYLVWPLLFLGVAALTARSVRIEEDDDATRRALLLVVAVAALLSFGISIWLTTTSQPWAFFGMPTRIWEFAAGGILALAISRKVDFWAGAATAMQVAGLGLIAVGVFRYDMTTPYPGVAATVPALGAIALIVGGSRAPDSFVSRALSVTPLRALGRLSYAWYLWHWPLIGLAAVLHPQIGVTGKLMWSAAALVLAWLTHKYVEQPARNGGRLASIPTRWVAPAAVGVSLAMAGVAHFAMRSAERELSVRPQSVFARARVDRMEPSCWTNTVEEWKGPCVFGDRNSSTTLSLLGDSHAEHWLAGLDRAGKEHGWRIESHIKGGCPVADVPQRFSGRLERMYGECIRYREAMIREIIAKKPHAVILSNWDHYIPVKGSGLVWQVAADEWMEGLRRTYARFSNAGIKVIVIRGTPRTFVDVPVCLSRRAANLPFAGSCNYDRARAFIPHAIEAQDRAARNLNVSFVDMNDQICATPVCSPVRNGIVMFTDDNHLTASFTRSVGHLLGDRVSRVLVMR
jgi:peptidoglycan/LPS O-acetylase OafA/YrhL